MNDEELSRLAASFRDGDRRGFRILVDTLTRSLISTAYRYTRDWDLAHDLTQETWIKAYQKIIAYDPDRPFRAWLGTIHRNGCISHLRRAAARPESPQPHDRLEFLSHTDETPDPLETLERKEFGTRIKKALTVLTKRQLQVFVRVDLEQVEQRRVAETLGMSFPTLRTTLHHARRRLAGVLRRMEEAS